MTKKLQKSSTDKKIAGVCGGLAEYFNIDPIIPRAVFLFFLIMGGSGIILYLILALLLPEKK